MSRLLCVGFLGLIASSVAFGQQSIYSDQLDNGWLDWSWASVNFANSAPIEAGAHSIAVSQTGAWQGLYFHHSAQDASQFGTLSFWINGGATGGQNLILRATLSGVAQPVHQLAAPAANTWTKVEIPLATLGVATSTQFDGFWIQDNSGATESTFYVDEVSLSSQPVPSLVHVSVNASTALQTISPNMFGVNTAAWDSSFDTPATTALLNDAGVRFMRFPGGSLSDEYHWATNTNLTNTWTWPTGFSQFAEAAKGVYPQLVFTANYGTGTPAEAAAWATAAKGKGVYVHYWEVGNECFGTWETDTHARPHDPYTYGIQAAATIKAIKAVDPGAQVGIVVDSSEDTFVNYTDHPAKNPRTGLTHNGWTPVVLATMAAQKVKPDFVAYHSYAQGPGGESDDGLLLQPSPWLNAMAGIRQMLSDYIGAANSKSIAIFVTENNSVYANPGKQSTSLVNGLFLADSLAHALQTEAKGFVWWDLRNGQETANNNSPGLYGWRPYGDYGIVGAANDKYPSYYAMKLLKYFARGGDTVVSSSSDYKPLTAYAVKQANGTLALLVINKSAKNALTASLNVSGFSFKPGATVYSYGIPNDNAAKNGLTVGRDVTKSALTLVGAVPQYTFPAYSMTVIQLAAMAPGV